MLLRICESSAWRSSVNGLNMAVRTIKKSWWIDITFNHTRYRKRSPENSKAGALAYEATLRMKLAQGDSLDKPMHSKNEQFKQSAWEWYESYVVSNNRAGEQKNKKIALTKYFIPFFGSMRLGDITVLHIEQFKASLRKQNLSPKTINNHLAILSKCLFDAYDWLELKGSLPKIARVKCPPPKTDHLSIEECGLLLSTAQGRIQEMILFALRTGMRRGEILGLQWSSIDWQNRIITVRHSLSDYTKKLDTTKSSRERYIPIDLDVYRLLFKRRRDTGFVFVDLNGKPFNTDHLERHLHKLCKHAGLRNIGWHTLRHTFASQLAMKGVPLNAVQSLLGHSSVVTTMRYAHLAPSTLRLAIDQLNPLFRDFGQPVGNQWSTALENNITQKNNTPNECYFKAHSEKLN
jgi:integrase